jgi:hypothetical protein
LPVASLKGIKGECASELAYKKEAKRIVFNGYYGVATGCFAQEMFVDLGLAPD